MPVPQLQHIRGYTCKDPDDFSTFNFCFILEFMGIPTETKHTNKHRDEHTWLQHHLRNTLIPQHHLTASHHSAQTPPISHGYRPLTAQNRLRRAPDPGASTPPGPPPSHRLTPKMAGAHPFVAPPPAAAQPMGSRARSPPSPERRSAAARPQRPPAKARLAPRGCSPAPPHPPGARSPPAAAAARARSPPRTAPYEAARLAGSRLPSRHVTSSQWQAALAPPCPASPVVAGGEGGGGVVR